MKKLRDIGLSHADAMQRHSCRAIWERHGIVMTAREYLDLCVMIFLGRDPVMRDDRGNLVYEVTRRGIHLYAIWSIKEARIRTLLPCKDWVVSRRIGKRFVRRPVVELGSA